MTDIRMADVSEFQSDVDGKAYLGAGYKCIIARTYNGYRLDHEMPARRDYLRGLDFTGIGWYAYLAADRDPEAQAHSFISSVGSLGGNEWPILDCEEGSGDRTRDCERWFAIVDDWAGFPAMLYSGDYYLGAQLSGAGHWQGRPLWVAAYQDNEPSTPHDLWQFTDGHYFTGIGACDGNLAHVSAEQFVSDARGGTASAAGPSPYPIEEADMITAVVKKDGRLEVFVEKNGDGSVWHTYQKTENGGWAGAEQGKNNAWYSLGTPPGKN